MSRGAAAALPCDAAADAVVVATPPGEAARLVSGVAPAWAAGARALRYEPIVTVYLRAPGVQMDEAMLALASDARRPAQFVFDLGRLQGQDGLLAFVISGAAPWVERGSAATARAVLEQAGSLRGPRQTGPFEVVQTLTEKRATFACTPGLVRPPQRIAPGLVAAGDYVQGPYPATLEGAIRSGIEAIDALSP